MSNKEYPFSKEAAQDANEVYNVDLYAMYDHRPFEFARIVKPGAVISSDYQEDRVNILATIDNAVYDIYRG